MGKEVKSVEVPSGILHRRTVLLGAISGVAFATINAINEPTHSFADDKFESVIRFSKDEMYVPTDNGLVFTTPRLLGGFIDVGKLPIPKGARIVVDWDSRLYDLYEPRLSYGSLSISIVQQGKIRTGADGMSHAVFRTLEPMPALAECIMNFGTTKTQQYPKDLIDNPGATTILIEHQGRIISKLSSLNGEKAESKVWGVVMSVGWVEETWGSDGYRTWRPDSITLYSTGPGSVPAKTRIRVQLDRQVFNELSFTSLKKHKGREKDNTPQGSVAESTWVVSQALEARERLTLQFDAKFSPPFGELRILQNPLVSVTAPAQSLGQRTTGQESATRVDSVFSKETLLMYPSLALS